MAGHISRHGYCRCPHCDTHVRLRDFEVAGKGADKRNDETPTRECHSCGAELTRDELVAEQVERGVLASLRSLARGRSGLIAAGLLSLSTFGATACGDSTGSTDSKVVSDTGGGQTDGTAGDAGADQSAPTPDQGGPDQAGPDFSSPLPDKGTPTPDKGTVTPDKGVTKPDRGIVGRDGGISPLYGIPPIPRDSGAKK